MSKKVKPTASELEILNIVWEEEPVTVRRVNDRLNEEKDTGYTTTLKLMQIMTEKKGLLKRVIDGRKHLYSAIVKKVDTQNVLLNDMIQKTFEGSAMNLVMQALGNHKTTPEELQKIKNLIENIEKKG